MEAHGVLGQQAGFAVQADVVAVVLGFQSIDLVSDLGG